MQKTKQFDESNIQVDYKSLENDVNFLIQQLFIKQKANLNSKIKISFKPIINVQNVVNGKIIENVYTDENL